MDAETVVREEPTPAGLDMIVDLAEKGLELHLKAFDDVDAKANGMVGHIAIATALLGLIVRTSPSETASPVVSYLAVGGIACFVVGICLALLALMPRNLKGYPRSGQTVDYWDYHGDGSAKRAVVEALEQAQEVAKAATLRKCALVTAGQVAICLGLLSVAGMVARMVL